MPRISKKKETSAAELEERLERVERRIDAMYWWFLERKGMEESREKAAALQAGIR